jgi:flagellar basal body-associated protein FliL
MLFIRQNQILGLLVAVLFAFSSVSAHASGHEGGESEKAKGPMYVDFKNIVIPVIKKNGKTGVIALAVMAEVDDQEGHNQVTSQLPKLRDAFIRTLYGNMESNKFVRDDGALDIDHIKERLLKTAAYVMKSDKENPIKDILFQNISQQSY